MRAQSKKATAAEVWRLMSDFSMSQFGRKSGMLHELGLTPGHMKALLVLDPQEARPMGSCAQALGCDASTATWLIDRLEERGLVERRGSATDRRVKEVVLTERGIDFKRTLEQHYYEPPAELAGLDLDALMTLRDALKKIAPAGPSSEHDRPVHQAG